MAAFVVIAGLVVFFWLVLIDGYVRRGIERTLAFLVGAEVNVEEVDLVLSPLGFVVTRIQVTDPADPAVNAVEIQRVAFTLDTADLIMRKTVIERMGVEGVALGTPREKPGRVYREAAEEADPPAGRRVPFFTVPDLSREDIRQAIEAADLETLRSIDALNSRIQDRNRFWEERIGQLPDEDRLSGYRERIEALRQSDERGIGALLRQAPEVRDLYSDIDADLGLLRESYGQFTQDYRALVSQTDLLARQPARDAQRIVQTYGPSPENIGSASRVLFGESVGTWVERSLRWHARLVPLLERSELTREERREVRPPRREGIDVRFREYSPIPDFLVRTAAVSVLTRGRTLAGTISNFTPDQDILGLPLTFLFSGENLGSIGGIRLDGVFDHTEPQEPRDSVRLAMNGYRLRPRDLGQGVLPVTLTGGSLDVDLTSVITDSSLSASLTGAVSEAGFVVDRESGAPAAAAIAESLSGIDSFSLLAGVSGTPDDYEIELSSSLGKVLQGVVESFVRQQAAGFEVRVRGEIEQRLSEPIESLRNNAASLNVIDREFSARISRAEELLSSGIFKGMSF